MLLPRGADCQRPGVRGSPARLAAYWLLALCALLSIVIAVPTSAFAYWHGTGSGVGQSTTGVLAAPTLVVVPATSGSGVAISWTASTGTIAPSGYLITRVSASGRLPACGSSATALVTGTSCSDLLVADGSYSYTVTAVFRSWSATSEPSASVTVATPTHLVFTAQPGDSAAGEVITPSIEVTVETASGAPVETAGIEVAMGIGTNPSSGTLTGSTSVATDAAGVAVFTDLSIDNAGIGYVLSATSVGLTPAGSVAFAVTGAPSLGSAAAFSVLAGTGVLNTGSSVISGDLGVSPSNSITGFPPGIVAGTIHAADSTAAAAQVALAAAYTDAATRTADTQFSGDQNGATFHAGVHHTAAAFALTGILTLDGEGDPNAVFIFQIDAALNTAASSSMLLINGATAANVIWQVNGAAGIGATATFSGTILSTAAITIGAGSQLTGRALSPATVTLAGNDIRFTVAIPPTITINGGASIVRKVDAPVISGTSDAAVGRPLTVTVGPQGLSTTVQADHSWSVTPAALAAGVYSIVATVRDAAGNAAKATQQLMIELNPLPVDLGSAAAFSVLAGTGVLNTGSSVISGDLGVSPGNSITGFPPGIVAGSIHAADSTAAAAQVALAAAYTDAATRTADTQFSGDQNGATFHAGVHHTAAAFALTGILTLDGEGDPNAVFIFQIDAALNTAASSSMLLINGATAANVIWQVNGAAGIGATATFSGTILSTAAITIGAGSQLTGRALSPATVTLAGNDVRFTP